MSDGAKSRPGGRDAAKPARRGLGDWIGELVGKISVQVSPPTHEASARMAPVRRDRRETYDEMVYRKTEGADGTAPMKRVKKEREGVAREIRERPNGVARKI